MTAEEIAQVNALVQEAVLEGYGVDIREMSINEAKERFSALSPLNHYFSTIDLGFTIHKEPEGDPDWGHYDSVCELELGRVFGRMAVEIMGGE